MSFWLDDSYIMTNGQTARPYDLHCVQISKSADLRNDCAKRKGSWHNRLQCKSYQRGAERSPEGGSVSSAWFSRSGAEGRHEPLSAAFSLSEAKGERPRSPVAA